MKELEIKDVTEKLEQEVSAELVGQAPEQDTMHTGNNSACTGEGCQNCSDISAKMAAYEQENKKEITATALPEHVRVKLEEVLTTLRELGQEVILKQVQAIEKNKHIKARVQILMDSGKVQIDQEEFNRSEVSVLRYAEVLNQIIAEVEQEGMFISKLLRQEPGAIMHVWKQDADSFEAYVQARIKFVKQYIKTVKKNLFISFSRYCFGFDAQEQRIGYIESLVRNAVLSEAKAQEKQIAQ